VKRFMALSGSRNWLRWRLQLLCLREISEWRPHVKCSFEQQNF